MNVHTYMWGGEHTSAYLCKGKSYAVEKIPMRETKRFGCTNSEGYSVLFKRTLK